MSLFNSIKRVLGFGDDDIEEEIGIDATVTPINATRQMARDDAQADDDSDSDHLDASAATEEELPSIAPDEIFEHVLKIFNESLPTFIKESIDTEAQRKYLYETLDQSIKTHLSEVQNRLAEQMERRKRFEMDQLRKQLHEAGEKAKKTEESSGEWKKQQVRKGRSPKGSTTSKTKSTNCRPNVSSLNSKTSRSSIKSGYTRFRKTTWTISAMR